MRDIGRNDPCPCGSGLGYKKCCLERAEPTSPGAADEFFGDVREAIYDTINGLFVSQMLA